MLTLYVMFAMGGVLLLTAPPPETRTSVVQAVGFVVTWPGYVIADLWLSRRKKRSKG